VIDAEIRSPFVSIRISESRCFPKSSNLTLALPMGSSSGVRSDLSISRCRECLCISILRSLPSMSMLHHMNMYDYLDTKCATHYFLRVGFKRCTPLILLANFPLTRLRGQLGSSEHLTTSGRGNPSSSCPTNS